MKVLVICSYGRNRSRHLAEYLQLKGIDAIFGGVREGSKILQAKIDQVDTVVTVHPDVYQTLIANCRLNDKRIIELDVEDRPEVVLPEGGVLDGESWLKFQETYVYPQLIKQIDEKLLLK